MMANLLLIKKQKKHEQFNIFITTLMLKNIA